jgi:hypothetical protein
MSTRDRTAASRPGPRRPAALRAGPAAVRIGAPAFRKSPQCTRSLAVLTVRSGGNDIVRNFFLGVEPRIH